MTLDLTTAQQSLEMRKRRGPIRWLVFSKYVMMEMFLAFVNAKLRRSEAIVWMAGILQGEKGYVFKVALPELRHSSSICAETDHSWLLEWLTMIRTNYPFVNLIVQGHIHPLDSDLSYRDEQTLLNLSDWSGDTCFASLVFDFDLGCYSVNDERITKLSWGVDEVRPGNNPAEALECFTTSRLSWVRRIFRRLSRRR